jgi:hypothetical protein
MMPVRMHLGHPEMAKLQAAALRLGYPEMAKLQTLPRWGSDRPTSYAHSVKCGQQPAHSLRLWYLSRSKQKPQGVSPDLEE